VELHLGQRHFNTHPEQTRTKEFREELTRFKGGAGGSQEQRRRRWSCVGKTVNVKLTPEVTSMYRAASQQHRKLKSLLNYVERLSQTVLQYQAKLAQIRAPRLIAKPGLFSYPRHLVRSKIGNSALSRSFHMWLVVVLK
jgi:hypothetical protein